MILRKTLKRSLIEVHGFNPVGVKLSQDPDTLLPGIRPCKFLSLSGANKIMLIFADFLFVPIEHIINENELLHYFAQLS